MYSLSNYKAVRTVFARGSISQALKGKIAELRGAVWLQDLSACIDSYRSLIEFQERSLYAPRAVVIAALPAYEVPVFGIVGINNFESAKEVEVAQVVFLCFTK